MQEIMEARFRGATLVMDRVGNVQVTRVKSTDLETVKDVSGENKTKVQDCSQIHKSGLMDSTDGKSGSKRRQ